MIRAVTGGLVYFLAVFAVAAVFGTVRELYVAPLVTSELAIVMEAPLIAVVALFAARWAVPRFGVGPSILSRFVMSATAMTLLIGAEEVLSQILRDRSLFDVWTGYGHLAGAANFIALLFFFAAPFPPRGPTTAEPVPA